MNTQSCSVFPLTPHPSALTPQPSIPTLLSATYVHNLPIDPTPDTLNFYAIFLSTHISPKSVTAYLSGISHQLEPYFPDV
jgi:hypothetical protein